jgi:PAS domain S-box-containing protein
VEDELNRALEVLPAMVWIALASGRVDFVNQRWCAYVGVDSSSACGQEWHDAVHPHDLPQVMERWQAIIASGNPSEVEARLRRSDGYYRWFLLSINPIRDEKRDVNRWLSINTDIHEYKQRANDRGGTSSHDLRSVINTIPMTAWSTLADGYCDFCNQHWLDYTGLSLEQAQGWGWEEAIHPEDRHVLRERWQLCLRSGSAVKNEARMRRFDGTYRWFLFLGNPLRDENGEIVKWFGTNIDIEDRKRAEEDLKTKERDLIRIINTIPTTAWATRPDGFCEFLSDRWLDYAGFTYEQAVGWRWAAVIHPEDAAGLQEHWLGSLASGTPVNAEARMRRSDGVYRWFLFLACPFRDESGTIIKWYGTNVDIEDRKRADEALRESERNLIQIINTIPTLAWSNDSDGRVDFLNKRWLEFTGLSTEEAWGQGWSAAIHPDDARPLAEYWYRALATGEQVDWEARMRRFDGEYRWFLFRASPLRDAAGKIQKWYGTNVDIEDRKRADAELRRSEAFLAEGQRLNLSGSFSWCLSTDAITFSEQLYRIYEFDSGVQLSPSLIASRLHPDDAQLVPEKIAMAKEGNDDLNYEFRLQMLNGSVKYLRTVAHLTTDWAGRPEMIGVVQDVTERQLAEEALGKVRSELARMVRVASLGALTASIAHEVSQPLSGIITNANAGLRMLAAKQPNIDGALDTVRRTLRDGNRASEVISRLRSLFGNNSVTTESIDLNEAIQEVLALLRVELQRNRVVLRMEFGDNLPAVVGDRIQIQQVVLNLLLNASEAMADVQDRQRQLLVKTQRDTDGWASVTVSDSGCGFEPERVEQLFDAFYTTKHGGMGMGLSVSRSIMQSHRGHLRASPNDGPGASLYFSMPPAPEQNSQSAKSIVLDDLQDVAKDL